MRRGVVLLILGAALSAVPSAVAELRPIRRDAGEVTLPRVRAGTIQIPRGQARGRVPVIVGLRLPPLAAYHRGLAASAGRTRLNVRSAAAAAYVSRLRSAQQRAVAAVRRAVPEATIGRRFQILLNGFAAEIPAGRLPALVRVPSVARVYPSVTYVRTSNDSPSVVGAPAFIAATGAQGEGVKIGVVDTGVDPGNRFFDPTGYSYPPGFPKGDRRFTTAKVIVARSFPGPGSGRRGRLPVVRGDSSHGTHVAGSAAGNAGTTAPPGFDHPAVAGLSGIAPRAWIGNYRVFNVPSPIGTIANSPEIIAAFESAVADGMDVINFSGGGPTTDPVNDPLIEAVRNVVAAGVVPVISAGNDRDEFGMGTAGSPGTAPEALTVAAVTNRHVFAPALSVVAPGAPEHLKFIPLSPHAQQRTPPAWATVDQTLVDVISLTGRDGKPVDGYLCGPVNNPNGGPNPLRPGSLTGQIALAFRGRCTFVSKVARARAAGAVGLILIENRPGEATTIPIRLALPVGMISDYDGARLREFMATTGGRTLIRTGREHLELKTGRSGIVTYFSSAGPTAFGHALKPDVAAPGGQILSSTTAGPGGPFAVYDGTSMAAPHVSGAVALLLQRHPEWTPRQVKSALMSTAGPAWRDTARTAEAPVLLTGAGLINIPAADDPKVFTEPASLSFGDLNVNAGAQRRSTFLTISDARDGAGVWQIELRPQSASEGARIEIQPEVMLAPGDDVQIPLTVRAAADAQAGDNYGFLVLRRGDVVRRIPYAFFVTRPALAGASPVRLRALQVGDTRRGVSRVSRYRFPDAPFGASPAYNEGVPMAEDGAETVYFTHITEPVANFGVSVLAASDGAIVDPWVLGSLDENDVQGYAGTPVNVNNFMFDYRVDVGAAGAVFPRPGRYYVSVDSGRDPFTGRLRAGRYLLRAWIDDVMPPLVLPLTTRVSVGRPTLVARVVDTGSGVDPFSLVIGYRGVLVGAAAYDPFSGTAVFPLPREAPRIPAGRTRAVVVASDYQETKNVVTPRNVILPNTAFRPVTLRAVRGPAVTWVSPFARECVARRQRLVVVASASRRLRAVQFYDGTRRLATVRRGVVGIYGTTWRTGAARRGRHVLRAVAVDRAGARASATLPVRVCRRR